MPRNPRTARHRALLRALVTMTTAALLVMVTALPALAASAATKPTEDANPYLIGSLPELATASAVGIALAVLVWIMLPAQAETADDEHH